MAFQFENRYVMTEEMMREYISKIICHGLAKSCALFSALCVLLCLASIHFNGFGTAAVLSSFSALGIIAGFSLPFLAARQCCRGGAAEEEEIVVQFGARILLTERGVQTWYDYNEITAVQVLRTVSILEIGKRDAIVLSSAGFRQAEHISFWHFFREKRPDLWARIKIRRELRRTAV